MGIWKPTYPSRLDMGHPLSDMLMCAYFLNERKGTSVYNSGLIKSSGTFNMVSNYWVETSEGQGLFYNGIVGNDLILTPPLSSGVYSIVLWLNEQNSVENNYLFDARQGGGVGYCYINQAGPTLVKSSGTVYVDSVPTDNFSISAYHMAAITGITISAPAYLVIGGYKDLRSAFRHKGPLYQALVYQKTLTQADILSLYQNPYQMIQQPEPIWEYYTAGAPAGIEVSATTDSLTLTEYSSNVNAETNVQSGIDFLTLTEYAADVNLDVSISASVDELALTEYAAGINAETNISAGIDELIITALNATVFVGANVEVSATTDELLVTEYPANINAEVSIAAGFDDLTLTENAASVNNIINISAALDELALTENAADVKIDISIISALESLTLTEYPASVTTLEAWTDVVITGIDIISGNPVRIIGKYRKIL